MMDIAGFVKTSFVDYPGQIASVIFTQGCNLRCGYCQNLNLIDKDDASNTILPEEIFEFLSRRIGMIDAVVISGGEPTLQKDLQVFITGLKELKLLVKLDTNGTNPAILRRLIQDELLDFIAMDLKASLRKYQRITGASPPELAAIRQSVEAIKNCGVAHEFRTTLCPGLEAEDISAIIADFEISCNYVVQNCRDTNLIKVFRNKEDLRRLRQWSRKRLFLMRGFEEDKVMKS